MSIVFKSKYLAELRQRLKEKAPPSLLNVLYRKSWVVYAKRPFGNNSSVVEYLGRYTHKVAISNHRIKNIGATTVTFSYKDYKSGAQNKEMTLCHEEFIRRFSQHILPKRLVRIRHYGILSSTWKRARLSALQARMQLKQTEIKTKTIRIKKCPCCKSGSLKILLTFDHRGPPTDYQHRWENVMSSCNH